MEIKTTFLQINPINRIRKAYNKKRLKNSDISIIASNCLGGLIYNDLGLRFLSPTINTRFDSKQFVKFVLNMEHYLQKGIRFVPSEEPFPVGLLDDITVYFVHYKTAEEAREKWEERKKRINPDNLFILLNDCDGIDEKDLEMLDKSGYDNIAVFTSKESYSKYKCACFLPCYRGQEHIGNVMLKSWVTGAMKLEREFDLIRWFNQERGQGVQQYLV